MQTGEYPYAGLILSDPGEIDTGPYLNAAAGALSRNDGGSGMAPRRSRKRAAVMGDRYGLVIQPQPAHSGGARLAVCALARGGGMPGGEEVARILSDAVLDMLKLAPVEAVEWCAPGVLIEPAEFIRLRSYVSPRRKQLAPIGHQQEEALADSIREAMEKVAAEMPDGLADAPDRRRERRAMPEAAPPPVRMRTLDELIDEDLLREEAQADAVADGDGEEAAPLPAQARRSLLPGFLRRRFARRDPAERRLTIAGWLMTGMLAVLSMPVAAALVVVGLLRGMDFRLAVQALSVTALFAVLQNSGSLSVILQKVLH